MDEDICDHCRTNVRVKTWEIGGPRRMSSVISCCWLCAKDIVKMQKEILEWVG